MVAKTVAHAIVVRVAVGLAAAILVGCSATPRDFIASSPSPAPSQEYPGRSHPPRDVIATFEDEVDDRVPPPAESQRLIALALADAGVRARLSGTRFEVLYVIAPPATSEESKETDPQTLPEVVIYDYSADRWLAVPVDPQSNAVGPIKERDPRIDGQPPIAPIEADQAVAIAMADPAVIRLSARGFKLVDEPVRQGRLGGVDCDTARCVLVILFSDSLGLSTFVQVDLGSGRVAGVYEQ